MRAAASSRPPSTGLALVVLAAGCCAACAPGGGGNDGGADDVATSEGGDGPAEGLDADGGDDGGEGVAGPATFLVETVGLTGDRWCDFDGDGLGDNSVADLGEPHASMLMTMVNSSTLQANIDGEQARRTVFHLTWVDDLSVPEDDEVLLTAFTGRDTDEPEDPSDDFSGEEPFHAEWEELDGCGEPAIKGWGSIDAGVLTVGIDDAESLFDGFPFEQVRLSGEIEPLGTGAAMSLCGVLRIQALGDSVGFSGGDVTALEELLAGGARHGVPTIPGLLPDVDLDGDGLERFVVDEEGRITACIDGDRTEITGNDCWADPRMADAFGIVLQIEAVSALFAGRQPDWAEVWERHGVTCEEPPEESLWDWR